MTVNELKKKCEEMIADGYGDSKIILCVNEDEFHWLKSGFSSPIYNDRNIDRFLRWYNEEADDVLVLN